jgi:isocitrate lyase
MAAFQSATQLAKSWKTDRRWKGIQRPYTPEDVLRLRGTLPIEYTLARFGAERLWEMLNGDGYGNLCQRLAVRRRRQ